MTTESEIDIKQGPHLNSPLNDGCIICGDFNSRKSGRNIILLETKDAVVYPDFAPIDFGHFLISPKKHYTSLANTPKHVRDVCYGLADELVDIFTNKNKKAVIAEHGTGLTNGPTNSCFEHAHLHVLPFENNEEISALIHQYTLQGGKPEIIRERDKLSNFAGVPYTSLQLDQSRLLIWQGQLKFFPQFFRNTSCIAKGYKRDDPRMLWQRSIDIELALKSALHVAPLIKNLNRLDRKVLNEYRTVKKLIRDKIIDEIKLKEEHPVYRRVIGVEYEAMVKQKIIEELNEFYLDPSEEEAGDIFEALSMLMKMHSISDESIRKARDRKIKEKGAFQQGFVLDYILKLR